MQPNFWLDPKMGTTYIVAAQTPQIRLGSVKELENTPIPVSTLNDRAALLGNIAQVCPRPHCRPSSIITTASRFSISTPICRTAIWDPWRRTSIASWPRKTNNFPLEPGSSSAAKWKA